MYNDYDIKFKVICSWLLIFTIIDYRYNKRWIVYGCYNCMDYGELLYSYSLLNLTEYLILQQIHCKFKNNILNRSTFSAAYWI